MNKVMGKTESGKDIFSVHPAGAYENFDRLSDKLRVLHLYLSYPKYNAQDHLDASELHAAHAAASSLPAEPPSRKARMLAAAKAHRHCAHMPTHALDSNR